jgi:hypothetical protein
VVMKNELLPHADARDEEALLRNGRFRKFIEQTDFYKMKPRDDLAAGSTKRVLANPGNSYIAYTDDYSASMGVKGMVRDSYDLTWFDAASGRTIPQSNIPVESGDITWPKPDDLDREIALYIKRRGVR